MRHWVSVNNAELFRRVPTDGADLGREAHAWQPRTTIDGRRASTEHPYLKASHAKSGAGALDSLQVADAEEVLPLPRICQPMAAPRCTAGAGSEGWIRWLNLCRVESRHNRAIIATHWSCSAAA